MTLVIGYRGSGQSGRATYLGKDVAHIVLNAVASKKFKPKIIVVPKSIVQPKLVDKIEGADIVTNPTGA